MGRGESSPAQPHPAAGSDPSSRLSQAPPAKSAASHPSLPYLCPSPVLPQVPLLGRPPPLGCLADSYQHGTTPPPQSPPPVLEAPTCLPSGTAGGEETQAPLGAAPRPASSSGPQALGQRGPRSSTIADWTLPWGPGQVSAPGSQCWWVGKSLCAPAPHSSPQARLQDRMVPAPCTFADQSRTTQTQPRAVPVHWAKEPWPPSPQLSTISIGPH